MELALVYQQIDELIQRVEALKLQLSFADKQQKLIQTKTQLAQPDIWQHPQKAQMLGQQKVVLTQLCNTFIQLDSILVNARDLLTLAAEENDQKATQSVIDDVDQCEKTIAKLEFESMFSGKLDINDAYLDIQSGSGGTEAQDWTEMLLRMYLRFIEAHKFKATIMELSQGEVAGIKSVTIHIKGVYAFGWLRTETGIHRLVRKSPFNAGGKRHTSFASVFVSPEVDDNISIEINPADLRIDTYRASGAGGQHVNKTDSAVRITHLPTNTVVQCQDGRSQHNNKDRAMKQLRSKLYELELQKRELEKQGLEASKSDIGWGRQIRSYVLDDSRIKDLRTGVESRNTSAVLDGNLDKFIEASLKSGY